MKAGLETSEFKSLESTQKMGWLGTIIGGAIALVGTVAGFILTTGPDVLPVLQTFSPEAAAALGAIIMLASLWANKSANKTYTESRTALKGKEIDAKIPS